jgi:hypothetical protein
MQANAAEMMRLACCLAGGHAPGPMPEVTPDGRVVAGYAAVVAARRAGLGEMEVVVREDLAGQSDALVAMEIIDSALACPGLPQLDVARCVRRAHELRGEIDYEYVRDYQRGDLYEQVARRLKCSPRSAQRYDRLGGAPAEVRAAFTAGRVPLILAERAADLPLAKQADLAVALHGCTDPQKVLAQFVKMPGRRPRRAYDAFRALLTSLDGGLKDLDGRLGDVKALTPEDAALLDRAVEQLQAVRRAAAVVSPQQQAAAMQALRQSVGPARP